MAETTYRRPDAFSRAWWDQQTVCPAFCVSVISDGNEISCETLSAVSSFQAEHRHVVFCDWPEATETHHSLAD